MRNAFRPVGRFFCLMAWMAAWAMAQTSGPAMTQVTDTVYRADGTVAKGTVLISWPGFTTADGKAVAAGALSVQLGSGGAFTASLAPNTGAQPAGVYYKIIYQLAGQEPSTEYWVVPATGSTTIGAVRAKLQPPTIAAQVLTRDVADTNYVHVNGDQTMKGVVTFASSPSVPTPQNPSDAANKGYVDSVAAGIGNFASPPPIGGTTPNAGTFTTLNKVINPTAYAGNDLGMKVNAAIAANNCGNGIVSCSLELPPGAQMSYSTTIALPQDTRLACTPKAQNSQYATLNYTGNGHAIDLTGESASIDGCDWNIGASATEGIHQASFYTRVDNVSLNGGEEARSCTTSRGRISPTCLTRRYGTLRASARRWTTASTSISGP